MFWRARGIVLFGFLAVSAECTCALAAPLTGKFVW